MSELINIFRKLSEYFDRNLLWEQIEEIYEKFAHNQTNSTNKQHDRQSGEDSCDEDDQPLINIKKGNNISLKVTSLPLVQRSLSDPQVLSTLLELCTTIRHLRADTSSSYDNTFDCWDQVVKVAPRDGYLSFIYALAGLAQLDATSPTYTKLSLVAVNTYFLSLTIPGAKGFHIFEEDIISHCLQVFFLVERVQNPDILRRMSHQQPIEIWVQFSTFCDDLKLLLRYVHFNDHKGARDSVLKKLIDIQYLNHDRGYANLYAANLHTKCFEIFEEMINAHNGEPEETLMKLMNMTVFLHTYPPKPKTTNGPSHTGGHSNTDCEHISDWFIKSIAKYPRLLVKVLGFYIECVVTNPIKSWKAEQIQRALEYAAKYDAALFTKCNESCVEFLCEAVYAEEVMIRSRAIELMSRILQLESHVDWQMFRHEVSDIPREVHLIKELIDSLQDQNNNIKLKAVQALHSSLIKGSSNARKIFSECLRFTQFCDGNVKLPVEPRVRKNEIRYEKPVTQRPEYTFPGHGLVELAFLNLPSYVYSHLFQSSLSYIRRAGVMFMEQLVKLNPLLIFNTNFVEETTRLVDEPTALVRRQTLLSVDAILECYPNCYPVIWVWCKIIAPMFHDSDPKNVELAMDCFRTRVLLNMKGIDQSNKAEHFMPWVIIRTMLSTQSRFYLQNCFHLALQQRMVSSEILGIIESHLLTSNSTEAWIVLNFISGKVKSKEPDTLIHQFTSLQSWNKEQNMLIALEVLANCVQDFSHTALNHAFKHILTSIREGTMMPVLIGKAFDFLILIDNRSQKTGKKRQTITSTDKEWVLELHSHLEHKILSGIVDFPANRATLMSHLYAYSEVNVHTSLRPQQTIISFIHKYMNECIKLGDSGLHLENERLLNSMILLAGRLSLRDACVARTTCALYAGILQTCDRPPVVNTIIVALTDLGKKHTQIVENIMDRVLHKLNSPYAVNRLETFKCFEKLVLQDQLKLRGSLLLALLATLLDESQELASRASDFFAEFLAKKNSKLFQRCLVECPFVLNEYKNFDGLDSFSEAPIKSCLKGECNRKRRQQLYNHLMADMDDISLILYFGQLKLIAEKSQHDPLIKCEEGIALIKDVFYILRRVCQLTKDQKASTDNKEGAENKDDETLADINELASLDEAQKTGAGPSNNAATKGDTSFGGGGGKGRRGRREITTMADALAAFEKSLIFIPTIHKNIQAEDVAIEKSFDDLCKTLVKRFPNLIDYAEPAEFWNRYRIPKTPPGGGKTRRKRKCKSPTKTQSKLSSSSDHQSNIEADELEDINHNSESSDFDTDDELPLIAVRASSRSPTKRMRSSCAELTMEYLFNPNI